MFDADALARRELGWIVEHGLLVDRLWSALPAAGVHVHCPARVVELAQHDDGARLRLDDGGMLDARMVLAADGADSTVRELAGIATATHDYAQRGVVAFVSPGSRTRRTAWQRFLPGGRWRCCRSLTTWLRPTRRVARVRSSGRCRMPRRNACSPRRRLLQPRTHRGFRRAPGRLAVALATRGFPLRRQLADRYANRSRAAAR
jgi:2-octaprenyl-3-methyl-6-methoxy-1,4-benzoquinol hydroxylase